MPDPYRNALHPFDVNNSGAVTPVDAVLIINQLNAGGGGPLIPPTPPATVSVFYDVNGDNLLSPLDALLVIIALNAGVRSEAPSLEVTLLPAGEAPITDPAPSMPPPFGRGLMGTMKTLPGAPMNSFPPNATCGAGN